jgi:hypothetical protein
MVYQSFHDTGNSRVVLIYSKVQQKESVLRQLNTQSQTPNRHLPCSFHRNRKTAVIPMNQQSLKAKHGTDRCNYPTAVTEVTLFKTFLSSRKSRLSKLKRHQSGNHLFKVRFLSWSCFSLVSAQQKTPRGIEATHPG